MFNGDPKAPVPGAIGINLAAPADWSSELPFVDLGRFARPWISQRNGASWGSGPALSLDDRGNVRRLEANCYAETLLCTLDGGLYPSGRYRCSWLGRGTLTVSNAGKVVGKGAGHLLVDVDSTRGAVLVQLRSTDPDNPVRRLRFTPEGVSSEHGPFRSPFMRRWTGFGPIRFMDWQLTNNSTVSKWAQRPHPEDFSWAQRGIPLETIADLCNRLGADPWICIPHRADDDFVRRTGATLKLGLDARRMVYLEYSNEIWNSMFEQTRYCEQMGTALKLHSQPWEAGWRYSTQRSLEVFARFEEGFRARKRTVRVIASQAANTYIGEVKLRHRDAWKQVDALAIAPYMTFNVEPSRANAVVAGGVDGVLRAMERESLPESTRWMAEHKALAKQVGVRLIAYEAGQHAVGVGGAENNDKLTNVLTQANRHPRMAALYSSYLDRWRDSAGGDVCCLYSSCGLFGRYGSFGLIEHETDQTPKLRAVRDWMARR